MSIFDAGIGRIRDQLNSYIYNIKKGGRCPLFFCKTVKRLQRLIFSFWIAAICAAAAAISARALATSMSDC